MFTITFANITSLIELFKYETLGDIFRENSHKVITPTRYFP